MSLRDAMALIHRLEADYPVHEWQLGGMHIWPLIRFDIAGMLRHEPGQQQGTQLGGRRSAIARLTTAVRNEARARHRDAARDAPLTPCDVLLLGYSSYREHLGSVYYDRLLDPLREALADAGQSSLALEQAPGSEFRIPRARPSHYIHRRLVVRNLRARLARKADPGAIPQLTELLEELHQRELRLMSLTPARIAHRVAVINSYAAYFSAIIRRTRPRQLATAWYYGSEGLGLCLAARRAGIACTDIQHGVQGAQHFAYGPFHALPENGYNVLPSRFWCWTPDDAAQISAWGGDAHAAFHGGQPWASYLAADAAQPVREARSAVASAIERAGGTRHILVSLQWNLDDPFELLRAIHKAPPGYRWWVRLHPAQTGDRAELYARWEQEGAGRVVVRAASELPLPLLLSRMDAHVTRTSSVIKEAAAYGVPSVAYDPDAATYYADEHADGSLHTVAALDAVPAQLAAIFAAALPRNAAANPLTVDLADVVASHFSGAAG